MQPPIGVSGLGRENRLGKIRTVSTVRHKCPLTLTDLNFRVLS